MRGEERGKAGPVLLLALLCALGASVPVVALRPSCAVEEAAPEEQPAAIAPDDPGTPPAQDVPIEDTPFIATPEPVPPAPAAQPGLSLDDRLRGYFMG